MAHCLCPHPPTGISPSQSCPLVLWIAGDIILLKRSIFPPKLQPLQFENCILLYWNVNLNSSNCSALLPGTLWHNVAPHWRCATLNSDKSVWILFKKTTDKQKKKEKHKNQPFKKLNITGSHYVPHSPASFTRGLSVKFVLEGEPDKRRSSDSTL